MNIGILQGRLSPRGEKYQSFPEDYWESEFYLAKILGFQEIECVFDENPNNTINKGYKDILKVSMETGVFVKVICADYFMKHKFFGDNAEITHSISAMNKLIIEAYKIGVKNIVLPCIDESSFETNGNIMRFAKNIQPCLDYAGRYMINICVETDLVPNVVRNLIDDVKNPRFKVCYDTGNSASLGYDPIEELKFYGKNIAHIHFKDRLLKGPSVEIGTGATKFSEFLLNLGSYEGTASLQCARLKNLNEVEYIRKQKKTINDYIERYFHG